MNVAPVRRNISDAAFENLRDGITGGRWAPGERLPSERHLAAQMGVSRAVVREAIKHLVGQGLVEVKPRRGLFVKAASADILGDPFEHLIGTDFDRVMELLDLRRVLEARSAHLAARYATPDDLAALAEIHAEMARDRQRGVTGESADVRFHCAIASAAGNTVLAHLMATLHGALSKASRLLASRLMAAEHYREGMFARHTKIFEAIRDGNAKRAAAAMEDHFDFVVGEFSQYRRKSGDV